MFDRKIMKRKIRSNPEYIDIFYEITLHESFDAQKIVISNEYQAHEAAERMRYFFKRQGIKVDVYLFKVTRHYTLNEHEELEDETYQVEEVEF